MTFVVAERTFRKPQTVDLIRESIRGSDGCNALYGITHLGSLLGSDGLQAICFYQAPDAEVVRSSSQQLGIPYDRIWSGTLHGQGPEALTAWAPASSADPSWAIVLVSRAFDAPIAFDALQAQEAAQAWCLQAHCVRFVQSLFALDRKRMLSLYAAPDAEAVRHAQRGAGLPFEKIVTMAICAP